MIINKVYIGNKEEAFIESNFTKNINLVFSDDNNRGKTIVLQGLYYALGNEPIFPESFDYKNFYFIVDFNIDKENVIICRNKNNFVIKIYNQIHLCNSVTEFKYFFDKFIYKLPVIFKDNQLKTSELFLFYQLFFVGQDDRISHNIINHSYCNKDDFVNMLYAYIGVQNVDMNVNLTDIKEEIQKLGSERNTLLKENQFLKNNIPAARLAHYTLNREEITKKLKSLNVLKNEIINLQNDRNRLWNKKTKNEILLKELNSLNTTLLEGEVVCLDCHSSHIGYKNQKNGIQFDVSNIDIRKSILESIKSKIDMFSEECSKLEQKLNIKQVQLKELLKDEDVSLENLLMYKKDINQSETADTRIQQIDNKIAKLQASLKVVQNTNDSIETQKKELMQKILNEMSQFYNQVDPDGSKQFNSLFTVKGETFSGSEGALFYLSRIYAYAKVLKHSFPIIMDSFRDGEISTNKEAIILHLFGEIPNQIIFSSTLKTEEVGKYNKFENINKIDYSSHTPHHILNQDDVEGFNRIIEELLIQI